MDEFIPTFLPDEDVGWELVPRTKQVGGDHYSRHTIQPFDIIDEYGLNFYEGNAVKYILRRKDDTDRLTDLEKAKHYIEVLIQKEHIKRGIPAPEREA